MHTNQPICCTATLTKKELLMNTTTTPKMRDQKGCTLEKVQGTLTKFKSAWVSKSKEQYVSHLELLLVLGSLSSRSGRGSIEKNLIQSAKNNSKLLDAIKRSEKLVSMCDIANFEKDFYFSKREFLEIVENFIFEHDRNLVSPHDSEEVEKIVKCFFDNTTRIDCTWKDFERYVLTPLLFCN